MKPEKPIEWIEFPRSRIDFNPEVVSELIPPDVPRLARRFHRQIPGYALSPLKGLPNLADQLGLGGIWVKDESVRFNLRSFKVLGGSYAIYRLIRERLGITDQELGFSDLADPALHEKLGDLTFAAATDGASKPSGRTTPKLLLSTAPMTMLSARFTKTPRRTVGKLSPIPHGKGTRRSPSGSCRATPQC